MAQLHDKLASQIPALRDGIHALVKEHGSKVISEVTIAQTFGGMRGVKGMVCDTSVVEPDTGLVIRNIPIAQLASKLPEEVFYLLCTGELPDALPVQVLEAVLHVASPGAPPEAPPGTQDPAQASVWTIPITQRWRLFPSTAQAQVAGIPPQFGGGTAQHGEQS